MSERPRYALYYTPAPGSRLAAFGNGVVGYDSASGAALAAPAGLEGIAAVTAEPRAYGFHATLRAPMRLAATATEADLDAACAGLARARAPIAVGRMRVAALGAFLALVPEAPPPDLGMLAAECVAALDPLRAPLSEAERARRHPERLAPRGRALLDRWGYPHVFEAFRFHMTLTGPLAAPERDAWRARLAAAYGAGEGLVIDALTLLRQDGAAPFRVLRRIGFGDGEDRHGG
ncbi:DUF1045 domain-containing protein [uncultured Methylobacterium sp.]|uniref:DUF1045 domain-containing protein n=1 Tax=uncultured Methylobacterium sp. TaxID=157278 RepID=UPI0035C953CB